MDFHDLKKQPLKVWGSNCSI